jgi:hypothetical protein
MLITNLPGRIPTLRMRIWRALKAAGAGLLRDGVYVLPYSVAARRLFEEQRLEIKKAGGSAYVLPFESDSPDQNAELDHLFDRTAAYFELNRQLEAFRLDCARLPEDEARKRLNAIERDVAELQAIDFFPGKSSKQLQDVLEDAKSSLDALLSPDEPRAAHRKIPRRDRKDFQGRLWATRQHMWIDRVCSAWLIRRFIDRRARFVWLKRIQDKPKRAIGFDFDGAEYTHVDSKVTFEVLLTSFGLEANAGLARLGALVHFLDVGGIPVAEAKGFESIVSGARTLCAGDDALLKQVSPVLDSLYQSFVPSEPVPSK